MGQPDNTPQWAAWLGAAVPAAVAVYAFLRRFFGLVSREELREAIKDAKAAIDQRHAENITRLERQDKDLQDIRSMVSRIEGQISGTYKRLER